MANTEIEKTLKKITDTQLVIARLMETHERQWNKRFETSQGRMDRLERRTQELDRGAEHLLRAIEKLHRVAESHERSIERLEQTAGSHERSLEDLKDRTRTMLASMDRLIRTIEDFAKGRKREDGRR